MPRKPTGRPNGRPKKTIDRKEFEECCHILCTKDEICAIFSVDEVTLTRWCEDNYGMGFSDIYKKLSSGGKKSLRRMQYELAEKNATMAIWLGKQLLGQRDELAIDHGNNELLEALTQLTRKRIDE